MAHRSEEIAARVPHDRDIYGVEVGVRYGKNAAHLLRMLPRLHLTLVDPWRKPAPGDSYYDSGDGIADRPAGHFEKCLREAMWRLAQYRERIRVRRQTSLHAADSLTTIHTVCGKCGWTEIPGLFHIEKGTYEEEDYESGCCPGCSQPLGEYDYGPAQFDFVFLDGDHSYEGVKRDIHLWLPLVRSGGLLCGHDYAHPNIHGVKRAVDELLGDVELGADMTWFYYVP